MSFQLTADSGVSVLIEVEKYLWFAITILYIIKCDELV
jgi:hypothetical protein